MTYEKKKELCEKFFAELAGFLDGYEVVESCNNDCSRYLIPKGTKEQISYYGKPEGSFRVSDHWNWYSNVRKCSNESIVQCESLDLPKANERLAPGKASKPLQAFQVAVYHNGYYKCVYGQCYDRSTNKWYWKHADAFKLAEGGNF